MEDVKMFIERVKQLCLKKGIPSGKMLMDCNLNKNILSSANIRNTLPSTETIMKIAEYFDVSTDWLLTGDGEMQRVPEKKSVPQGYVAYTINPKGGVQETRTMSIDDWEEMMALAEAIKAARKKNR